MIDNLMSSQNNIILLVFIFLWFVPSSPLTIFYNNSPSISFDYKYSTLGIYPSYSIQANISFLLSDTVGSDCTLKDNSNIEGNIIIFENDIYNLGLFKECVTDYRGNGVALGKLIQQNGALGLVVWSSDVILGGRVIGFSDEITIPILVIDPYDLEDIFLSADNITGCEFPPVSISEKNRVVSLHNGFKGWVILNAVLYGVLLAFLGYLLYVEISVFIIRRSYYFGIIVKSVPFITCLFLVLWHSIDPYGFKGMDKWPSYFFINFGLSLEIVVFILILRIWVCAVVKARFTKGILNHPKIISRFLYSCAVFFVIVAFIACIVWSSEVLLYFYYILGLVLLVLCEIGYLVYGIAIVKMIKSSHNITREGGGLSKKIIIFVILYTIVGILTIVIDGLDAFGLIFGGLADSLVTWFGLLMTFFILFIKYSKNSPRGNSISPSPPSSEGAADKTNTMSSA